MDVVNFDALKAQDRIINISDIDPEEDYFVLGHYDPRRREFKSTDYPIYAVKAGDVLGPILSNADRQMANNNLNVSTTSDIYLDLANTTLTTNELATITAPATGTYQVFFSGTYLLSDDTSTAQFVLNVNGVDISASEINEAPGDINSHRTNMVWQLDNISSGTIIKIRFKITPSNPGVSSVMVTRRTLMIDGVNSTTII